MANSFRVSRGESFPYFITCTIVDWLPIFASDGYCRIVSESLAFLRQSKFTQINAFVLMPTHLHAVLWPREGVSLSDVMRDFKRFTSRQISDLAEKLGDQNFLDVFRRARKRENQTSASRYRVWQAGFHPEAIYSEDFARQKIDYIHNNPVRAGLAKTLLDWPYSSSHAYYSKSDGFPPIDVIEF
jgi:REP element-mobilizing transposase RayT